ATDRSRPERIRHGGAALAHQGRALEAVGSTICEAVERNDVCREELTVESDVEQEMHRGTAEIAPQKRTPRPPRDGCQQREQLPGVQHQYNALRAGLQVVAEEDRRA